MGHAASQFEDRVIIVGVGLIGGSIAAAVRQRFPKCAVIGVGRSEQRLQAAVEAGLLTNWTTDCSAELLQGATIVVVCLPVHLIADQIRSIAERCTDDVLITDAGSVKAAICSDVQSCSKAARLFVGSHPIAGGEQGGFEHAEADLFEGKICVVSEVDPESSNSAQVGRVSRFWKMLGCDVVQMSAAEHDRILALTSHLPHVMAATTTTVVGANNLALTGSGFRDATRIAAGNAALWRSILAGNRDQVVAAIQQAEVSLREFREALEQQDDEMVESLLDKAAKCRSALD